MADPIRTPGVESMLAQINAYQEKLAASRAEAGQGVQPLQATQQAEQRPGFPAAIRSAVQEVNNTQLHAEELRAAFERGDGVPLTDVVIAMQKSSLAFEATLQVRNKVMRAYEEIMNMPV